MKLREIEDSLQRVFGVACAYEAIAVLSGKSPTFSKLVRRSYTTPGGRVVLWLAYGWLTVHLFSPELNREAS